MAIAKVVSPQTDFSAGELDPTNKRASDHPSVKAGLRQASNFRILDSRAMSNRSGRLALFLESGRVDKITMSPGNTFYLCFAAATLRVRDSAGAVVFTSAGKPWSVSTAKNVRWAVYQNVVYITFPGMQPLELTWDGVSTWSVANYAETVTIGNQKRTFFYRISPKSVTMQPAARTGNGVAVTFSAGMNLVAGHVGTRMRFIGRQIQIASVLTSTTGTIDIKEPLIGSQVLTFTVDPTLSFSLGEEVKGTVTNSIGIITQMNSGAKTMTVQLLNEAISGDPKKAGAFGFTTADTVVGAASGLVPTNASVIGNPEPVSIWDDEVMNSFRGWPASCFVDQNRLGFCNFPPVPSAIGWSWIGLPNDLYLDAIPNAAIFELAPEKAQVFAVAPGAESSEFVFTDKGVWYILINATNPLIPGSVGFQRVCRDGCANVQPQPVAELLLFLSAGLTTVFAIVAVGATQRPYQAIDLSEWHNHLFDSPIAIAAPTTDSTFPESYFYVLNADGTVAVAKYSTENGQIKGPVGWVPHSGGGTIAWVSALGSEVDFVTTYAPNAITPVSVVERIDDTQYLDAAMFVNAAPAAFAPPPTKGPLWWLPLGSVDLIDTETRMMGTYQIDADGFIVPQGAGGEDLTSVALVAGQAWTATLEPFIPPVSGGQDVGQRTKKRRVIRHEVFVRRSTGFVMARLFSGPLTPTSPALGTIMNEVRFPAWNQGDIVTNPPPLREQAYRVRPLGRSDDPRVAIIKDTPGPLEVLESTVEVTG